jgi:hypothetical protein
MKNTLNTDARAAILEQLNAIDTRLISERAALKAEIATLTASISKGVPDMKNYATYNEYACALFEYKSNAEKLTFARQKLEAYNTANSVSVYPENGRKLYAEYKALNNSDRVQVIDNNRKNFELVLAALDELNALILEDHKAESMTPATIPYMESSTERDIKTAREILSRIITAGA